MSLPAYFPVRTYSTFLLLILSCGLCTVQTAYGQQRFAGGEMIVKFTKTSPIGKLIDRAGNQRSKNDKELTEYIAGLSNSLNTSLVVQSITSGTELLLAINKEVMLSNLRNMLKEHPSIVEIQPIPIDGAEKSLYRDKEFAIKFSPASKESKVLLGNQVTKSISEKTSFKLTSRLLADGRLAVGIDIRLTTLELVERLRNRDDVMYAQPNFILRPMNLHTN